MTLSARLGFSGTGMLMFVKYNYVFVILNFNFG